MERKEMKKRAKGLLALLLAFIMMFGTSLTVFAAGPEWTLNDGTSLKVNKTKMHAGETIYASGGGIKLTIDGNFIGENGGEGGNNGSHTLPGDSGTTYIVTGYSYTPNYYNSSYPLFEVKLTTYVPSTSDNSKSKKKDPAGTGYAHVHSFQWVETIEPTEYQDGLMENKCACGAVDESYVLSGSMTFVKKVVKLIQDAPQNGTVDITTKNYSCYTAWIIEELAKRPDVTLKTTYTDAEGNVKTFTIPAGQAPTDGAEFYGFTYLGNKYGWN